MMKRHDIMKKIILILVLLLVFISCSSINYKIEQEKQYIGDGSIQICTKRLLYFNNRYDHSGINEKIRRHLKIDSTNKVFIKDLPEIWQNLGFEIALFENFDDSTWEYMKNKYANYIVIYEKSGLFSSKLHAAELLNFEVWEDGSFKLYIDDPESGDDYILSTYSMNKTFLQIWALSIKDIKSKEKE